MAGRKRKAGKRTKSGRLSRAGIPAITYDRGTERAQAMRAIYGTDCTDAIGRAFRAGLLGDDGKQLVDTARAIARDYWRAFETGPITCAIGPRTHGSIAVLDHERIKRREAQLTEAMDFVNRMGANVRRSFDQLVIDPNPDAGPVWLDSLIWARKQGHPAMKAHTDKLREALDALEQLAL